MQFRQSKNNSMIALIEFIVVGIIFSLLVILPGQEKDPGRTKKKMGPGLIMKYIGSYLAFYLFSLILIVLALSLSIGIKDWSAEYKTLFLSSVMLFLGFFVFTATWFRMTDKISRSIC
jgi:hypothetical protein